MVWMVWYFVGSMIAAVLGLKFIGAILSPFFKMVSRTGSKPPSSSESGQQ